MSPKPDWLLVVDDDQGNRDMLSRRLERSGFLTSVAEGGEEAFTLIEQHPFDLILLDLMMPRISGMEALKILRQKYSPSQLPVIMVTADHQTKNIVEALNSGANDYITKPIDYAVAIARINTQLQRRRAELALLRSESRNRAILESALDGILILDSQGQVLEFNPAAVDMFGCTPAQMGATSIGELILMPSGSEAQSGSLSSCLAESSDVLGTHSERRARRISGAEFPVDLSMIRIPGSTPRLFAAFVRDITQRKRDEEELRSARDQLEMRVQERTAELVEANRALQAEIQERLRAELDLAAARDAAIAGARAKSEFLAAMSHEIRTPMNGIIGTTELALDTTLTAEQREYMEIAHSSATSLLALLNDILDFSKIEAGKLDLYESEFALGPALENICRSFTHAASQKSITLGALIEPDAPKLVITDELRLRQVLVNLISNGIKFTHHGHVAVQVGVDSASDDRMLLHFRVRDSGIGIPKDKQQAIFEAFTQADGSLTRRYGGTGLGLTIASRLVHLLGGSIWVESEPGLGSEFHFTASVRIPGRPPLLETAGSLRSDSH